MRTGQLQFWTGIFVLLLGMTLCAASADASVSPVFLITDFGPNSTLTTFTGLANGTEVNGLTVDGIQFLYSTGNGGLIIDSGLGVTNNINPPNITSVVPTGILLLRFPQYVANFGLGWGVFNDGMEENVFTIAVSAGPEFLGSYSGYVGFSNPVFTGGFAGIQASKPFNIATISFDRGGSFPSLFALDNIRTTPTIPEPTPIVLLGIGIIGFLLMDHRRRKA